MHWGGCRRRGAGLCLSLQRFYFYFRSWTADYRGWTLPTDSRLRRQALWKPLGLLSHVKVTAAVRKDGEALAPGMLCHRRSFAKARLVLVHPTCLNKIVEGFSVLWVAAEAAWQGRWWHSLLPGWPLAAHQIWMPFLSRSALGSLLTLPTQRPISPCHAGYSEEETRLVWTCRAVSCLSPSNYQRVTTLSLACN